MASAVFGTLSVSETFFASSCAFFCAAVTVCRDSRAFFSCSASTRLRRVTVFLSATVTSRNYQPRQPPHHQAGRSTHLRQPSAEVATARLNPRRVVLQSVEQEHDVCAAGNYVCGVRAGGEDDAESVADLGEPPAGALGEAGDFRGCGYARGLERGGGGG